MLKQRKTAGIIPNVIQQTIDQFRRKPHSLAFRRPRDGLRQLTTGHSRNKIVAAIDQFGQTAKAGSIPEKVRPHGQHYVDGRLALLYRLAQKLNEGIRFVLGCFACVAEKVFKLIYQEKHSSSISGQEWAQVCIGPFRIELSSGIEAGGSFRRCKKINGPARNVKNAASWQVRRCL